MTVSLDEAVLGTYRQIVPQVAAWLDKAEAHAAEQGIAIETLTAASLAPDMWPLAKQVFEVGHHSARAIEGVRRLQFGPEIDPAPTDLASLRAELEQTRQQLDAVAPGELDAVAGEIVEFKAGRFEASFTVSDFLLSLSLPNFYFHATTAYAILRGAGVPLGKIDFLGAMRMKPG